MKKVIKDIFLKLMFNILKIYITSQWFTIFTWKNENWKSRKTFHFYLKNEIEKVEKHLANLHDKYIVLAENIIPIKNIMQALKQAVGLKKLVLKSLAKSI